MFVDTVAFVGTKMLSGMGSVATAGGTVVAGESAACDSVASGRIGADAAIVGNGGAEMDRIGGNEIWERLVDTILLL